MDRGVTSGFVLGRLWKAVWHQGVLGWLWNAVWRQGVCCVDYGGRCDIGLCSVSIMDCGVTSGCVLCRLWTAVWRHVLCCVVEQRYLSLNMDSLCLYHRPMYTNTNFLHFLSLCVHILTFSLFYSLLPFPFPYKHGYELLVWFELGDFADSVLFASPGGSVTLSDRTDSRKFSLLKLKVNNFVSKIGLSGFSIADSSCNSSFRLPAWQSCWRSCIASTAIVAPPDMKANSKVLMCLTHCGRVTQICVFNTIKLSTSASSP